MAFLHFDARYAPCGFLIVPDGGNPYDDRITVLIQSDWDFPQVANAIGHPPCACGLTDGTVDCAHHTVSEMISAAYVFCRAHAGEPFSALDEYLPLTTTDDHDCADAREETHHDRD